MKLLYFLLRNALDSRREILLVTVVFWLLCVVLVGLFVFGVIPIADYSLIALMCLSVVAFILGLYFVFVPDWCTVYKNKQGEKVYFALFVSEYQDKESKESVLKNGLFVRFSDIDDFDVLQVCDVWQSDEKILVVYCENEVLVYTPKSDEYDSSTGSSCGHFKGMFDLGRAMFLLIDSADTVIELDYEGKAHLYQELEARGEKQLGYLNLIHNVVCNDEEITQKQENADIYYLALANQEKLYSLYMLCCKNDKVEFVCQMIDADELVCDKEILVKPVHSKESLAQKTYRFVLADKKENLYRLV